MEAQHNRAGSEFQTSFWLLYKFSSHIHVSGLIRICKNCHYLDLVNAVKCLFKIYIANTHHIVTSQ